MTDKHDQDEMLAAMAHDLRNPMNTILTGAAVLESQGQPDSVRISKMIMRAVRRMDELVGDMLDLAMLERGLAVEKQVAPVLPLIEDALRLAREQAGDKIIDASITVGGDAAIDPLRFGPALVRLLVLACGFSPAGGRVKLSAETGDGALVVRVTDSGAGIAPELVNDLFILHFSREPRGYRDRNASIVIAIAAGVARAHGGSLHAESAPGHGVTFTLTIPV